MRKVSLTLLSFFALAGMAAAQPSKLAWTRTQASTDLVMKRVEDVAVTQAGHILLSGASLNWDYHQACTGMLKRNRAVIDMFTKEMGYSSVTHFTVEIAGHGFISVGTMQPTAESPSRQCYIHLLDYELNLVAEKVFSATPESGDEMPTDIAVDSAGNIYICGTGDAGPLKTTWLVHVDRNLNSLMGLLLPGVVATAQPDYRPQIEVNGIIAVLIGLMNGPTPEVRSISPSGALNWVQGNLTDGFMSDATGHQDLFMGLSDHAEWSGSWNSSIGSGQFESRAAMRRINVATGAIESSTVLPPVAGGHTRLLVGTEHGVWGDPHVAWDFIASGTGIDLNLVGSGGIIATWESPSHLEVLGSAAMRDKFRETTVLNSYSWGVSNMGVLTKLSSTGMKRWEVPLGFQALTKNEKVVAHEESGDILALQGADNGFRLHCITQAPVAVTDTFRPRTGVLFRPLLPVTSNDRWAGGATISIVQPPAHGTLTMGANGFFNYTATGGYTGVDSFKYRLTKPGVNTSTATVNLIVGG